MRTTVGRSAPKTLSNKVGRLVHPLQNILVQSVTGCLGLSSYRDLTIPSRAGVLSRSVDSE